MMSLRIFGGIRITSFYYEGSAGLHKFPTDQSIDFLFVVPQNIIPPLSEGVAPQAFVKLCKGGKLPILNLSRKAIGCDDQTI